MAETIGQHQLATYSDPQNGQTPIDADQVTANDNGTVSGHNAHDSDAGIHLQSSVAASKPAAGSAGRKWFTSDTGQLFYDDGADWNEADYLNQTNGGTVAGAVAFTGQVTHTLGLRFASDNTVDIGATSTYRPRTVYVGTSVVIGTDPGGAEPLRVGGPARIDGALLFDTDATYAIGAAGATRPTIIYLATAGAIGTNPASAGALRLANAGTIAWRNSDNDGDVVGLAVNSAEQVVVGSANATAVVLTVGSAQLAMSTTAWVGATSATYDLGSSTLLWRDAFLSSSLRIGATPATSGAIRLANAVGITFRNAADSANIEALAITSGNRLRFLNYYLWPAADGSSGQVLQTNGAGTLTWAAASAGFVTGSGTIGQYGRWTSSSGFGDALLGDDGSIITAGSTILPSASGNYDLGSGSARWDDIYAVTLDATGTVTAAAFVGPLTGNITGNVSGNAGSATVLDTPRTINGVAFDGSQDVLLTSAIRQETGSTSLVLSDAEQVVEITGGSAADVTVPANGTVAFPVGTTITVFQYGAGLVTILAGGGVTLLLAPGATAVSAGQNGAIVLVKRSTNEWYVTGDLAT